MKSIIPNKIVFSLDELEKLGFFNKFTAKKMISEKIFNAFKIGNEYFIKKEELIKVIH